MKYENYNDKNIDELYSYNEVEFNGETVKIYTDIPTKQKVELIDRAIKLSQVNSVINDSALYSIVHGLVIAFYTDIEIEKELLFNAIEVQKIFDFYERKGFFEIVMENINKDNYNLLIGSLNSTINNYYRFLGTGTGTLSYLGAMLPDIIAPAMQKIQEDPNFLSTIESLINKNENVAEESND